MSFDNEKIIRNAYQIAEDKDAAGWIATFTEDCITGYVFELQEVKIKHFDRYAEGPVIAGQLGLA